MSSSSLNNRKIPISSSRHNSITSAKTTINSNLTSSSSHHNNLSNSSQINKSVSNASAISSIKDDNYDNTNLSITSSSSTTSIGGISMSRSSSLSSRINSTLTSKKLNNNGYNNSSSHHNILNNSNSALGINESNNDKSSGDLIKKIEDLVSRNKTLEEENNVLRNLIHEESGKSNFDERRILMLKCQIYQLEKQINVLSKLLSFRKNAHTDSINTISILADSIRSITQINDNKSFNGPPSSYSIERNEFLKWLELAESTRTKLYKSQDNEEDLDTINEPTLFNSTFSKSNSKTDILDICSGNLNHVNLRQVALLETNLADLFKKLTRLRESMKTSNQNIDLIEVSKNSNTSLNASSTKRKSEYMPVHKENMKSQLDECIKSTKDCCSNLFDLSLIVPSAPWQMIKKSPIADLKEETLIQKVRSFGLPKAKCQPVELILKSLYVSSNYHYHMKAMECGALNEELKFYRSCYSTQKNYVESVMNLFKTNYEQFVDVLRKNFNEPLRILIEKFWHMKEESTESSLKEFLGLFKVYAKKFETVLVNIDNMPKCDLISSTFTTLINDLDSQIDNLNKSCLSNLEKLNLNSVNLNDLSRQSDSLLSDMLNSSNNTNDF